MRLPRRMLLVVPVLATLVLGGAAAGQAAIGPADVNRAAGGPAALGGPRPLALVDEEIPPEVGLSSCVGTNQEAALVRMNDTPTTIGETGVFVPLPGAAVPVPVPANDTDQILVTFSGSSQLTGQPLTYALPADLVQVQILLNGVPMPPLNDPTFTTDVGQANALEACRRVPAGNYVVSVRWRIVDNAMMNALSATLEDWVLHVEVNN
jgi:hypothetical protein